jgi:hypothetical protein
MKKLLALIPLLITPFALADDAPFEGYADTYAEVVNHVSCFPHGIDKIGSGDMEGGMEIWNKCWGKDLVSRLNFVQASIVCPGEECKFLADQPDLRGPDMRAAIVKKGFALSKFTKSHHQLDTLNVKFDDPKHATVSGKITATHFSDHQGPEIHFVHWTGKLVKTDDGWRITEEDLTADAHSVLPQ